MRIFELVIIGFILFGCGAGIGWVLKDMYRQLKLYEERCIAEEDKEDEE